MTKDLVWFGFIAYQPLLVTQCQILEYTNKCPGHDTKQSNSEVPVMLELWGMRSTTSLPSLPGLL